MEKIVKKTSLREKQSDLNYWVSKTPLERLAALEYLRQQYINFNKNVQPRLQRVCKITNRKSS